MDNQKVNKANQKSFSPNMSATIEQRKQVAAWEFPSLMTWENTLAFLYNTKGFKEFFSTYS